MFNFFFQYNFFIVDYYYYIIYYIISSLFFLIFILISIALFTVMERKIMAALQKRKGPNVHGIWGSLQAFADGLKLLLKEDIVPSNANYFLFRLSPIYTFFISLSSWAIIPFSSITSYSSLFINIMYLFALSSLGVYGIILSGWASNSKYSFLGSLRSAAQMISYEVSIGFILLCIILFSSSLNLTKIVLDQIYCWNILPFFPLFFLFFMSVIAETNRAPFDLPEAEAELVSGYNVEYGGISFALFFLAEYGNIILMSTLTVIFFLGGWTVPFFFNSEFLLIFFLSLKVQVILFLFVWIRVAFPRYRYDQLMYLGWKVFLPFSMLFLFLFFFLIYQFDIFSSHLSINSFIYCDVTADQNAFNSREIDMKFSKNVKPRHFYLYENEFWQKQYYIDVRRKYIHEKLYLLLEKTIFNLSVQDRKYLVKSFLEELQTKSPVKLNLRLMKKILKNILVKNFSENSFTQLWYFLWQWENGYFNLDNFRSVDILYDGDYFNQLSHYLINSNLCNSYFCDLNFNVHEIYYDYYYFFAKNKMTPRFIIANNIIASCHHIWLNNLFILSVFANTFDFLSEAEYLLHVNTQHTIVLDDEQYYLYENFYKYEMDRYLITSLFEMDPDYMNIHWINDYSQELYYKYLTEESEKNYKYNYIFIHPNDLSTFQAQADELRTWWITIMNEKRKGAFWFYNANYTITFFVKV